MNQFMKNLMMVILALGLTVTSVYAEGNNGNFKKKHPRRAEVLGRANREERKNRDAFKDGKITKQQENKLNREDQSIKAQEQADAKANGGHITKAEQRDLNREENKVNRERNNMEKRDAGVVPVAPVVQGTPSH